MQLNTITAYKHKGEANKQLVYLHYQEDVC
jgi:hypothetical protein